MHEPTKTSGKGDERTNPLNLLVYLQGEGGERTYPLKPCGLSHKMGNKSKEQPTNIIYEVKL